MTYEFDVFWLAVFFDREPQKLVAGPYPDWDAAIDAIDAVAAARGVESHRLGLVTSTQTVSTNIDLDRGAA